MTGTALPGKVAMIINPDLLLILNSRCKRKVIITGTNGKTTTNNLINHILNSEYEDILSNLMGANMPQGVASAFLNNTKKVYDWGIFEVDEGSFPDVVKYIEPDYVVITNFFRDQLDRFGEIENTSNIVYEAIKPLNTTLILNADDPMVSNFKDLGKKNVYYGVEQTKFSSKTQRVVESRFCPICSNNLEYEYFNYGQLGRYECNSCDFKNPDYNYRVSEIEYHDDSYHFKVDNSKGQTNDVIFRYDGIYNAYNCCAAIAFSIEAGLDMEQVVERIDNFDYKLGRMENFEFQDKIVKIVLVKNPIGLSEVIKSISNDKRKKSLLFILNDNPADGTDVSWIWDANVEAINDIDNLTSIHCSGTRANDIALRIKYSESSGNNMEINDNMEESIENVLREDVEIIYILPTYTAVFLTRDYIMGHLNHTNARIPRIKELIKSKIGT